MEPVCEREGTLFLDALQLHELGPLLLGVSASLGLHLLYKWCTSTLVLEYGQELMEWSVQFRAFFFVGAQRSSSMTFIHRCNLSRAYY
jgi:hypothetical protein